MPLPSVLGAIGRVLSAGAGAGGGAASEVIGNATQAIFNAQTISSGVSQIAGLMKKLGGAILDLPLLPIKAFGEAAKLAQMPVKLLEHTVKTFTSAFGEASKAVQMPLTAVSVVMDGFSSAIGSVQTPLVGVVTSLKTMRDSIGMLGTAVSEFVRLANPVEVQKFNLAMDDMTGVFGKVLTPVLKASTALVRGFADIFFGMSNAFARAADKIFEPITKALPKVVNAFGPLVDGISDFVDMASDALAPLVDVGVKVFTELSSLFSKGATQFLDPILKVMPRITGAFKSIADSLSRTFDTVMEILGPVISALADIAGNQAAFVLSGIVSGLEMTAAMANGFISTLELLMSAFREIGNEMIRLSNAIFGSASMLGMVASRSGSKPLAGRSVDAAVRPATIGSVEDYGRKAQQAAFSLGSAADRPEVKTANATESLLTYIQGQFWTALKSSLVDSLPKFPEIPKSVDAAKVAINDAGRGLEDKAKKNYDAAMGWIRSQFN